LKNKSVQDYFYGTSNENILHDKRILFIPVRYVATNSQG